MQNEIIGVLYHDNRILNQNLAETNRLLLSLFSSMAALIIHNESLDDECTKFRKAAALAQAESTEELVDLASGEHIVGQSQGIIEVTQKTRQVAGTNTAVLILGETGVGKDLVAQALHNQSLRHQKPFIKVHCSALPESLITSELFGHEKGAFTGASAQRIGRFEQAHGGTLFLDEIGDMPYGLQSRILRVLQNGEIKPVGSTTQKSTNVRIISATNVDLTKAIQEKRFREDLFYRLNVLSLHIPPLRERREDIPLLLKQFIAVEARKLNIRQKRLSPAA
ncbi:MAG: sigma-54-dependent Fis family transcriptional regulator, partial [Deltaproteobacteria bacterium]|nr:sigma-54-dependent Fis family transcriptional regulator [Deltaproteobacteria bacterium]